MCGPVLNGAYGEGGLILLQSENHAHKKSINNAH